MNSAPWRCVRCDSARRDLVAFEWVPCADHHEHRVYHVGAAHRGTYVPTIPVHCAVPDGGRA